MSEQPSVDVVAARFAGAMRIAVVAIVVIWHFGYDVLILIRGWPVYRPPAVELAAWLIITGVLVAGAVVMLRDAQSAVAAWTLGGAAVAAGALAVAGYPPGQALSDVSWAWNTVGWLLVMLTLGRPVGELAVLLAANTGVTVAALLLDDAVDRTMAARLLTVVYATVGVQLLLAFFVGTLATRAREAAERAHRTEERLARRATRDAVHAARKRRYGELRLRVLPLLRGLADRRLDPADPRVRRRAGIEAARLRRLFAETDDAVHPLLHELRACADIAERRGVDVTLLAYGEPPALPPGVRRRLTEAPLQVLASAATAARITVMVDAAEVVVSVVADCPGDAVAVPDGPDAVLVDEETGELWIESRWQRRTP